jgi:DNA-binding GntR family transcriptional regulator
MPALPSQFPSEPGALLKENLASALKQAIIDGRLTPGERVIEGKWARAFGAAQASVREAINLLIAEGFLVKDAGRSARVVNYREQDIAHIYEVRTAIEGQAAQLICAKGTDISPLEAAFDRMTKAMAAHDMKALVRSDLEFHIGLIEAAANPLLADVGRKLLFPLFAFIQMRVLASGQATEAWAADMQYHRWMLQIIREGNPSLAGQFIEQCMRRFAAAAYQVWENQV